ncbi:MAG: hypothetical protein IMZ46_00455, partial [Acidobacteria bacterium]|nr:hypothetical protein [Acidobacteriota bacterium]
MRRVASAIKRFARAQDAAAARGADLLAVAGSLRAAAIGSRDDTLVQDLVERQLLRDILAWREAGVQLNGLPQKRLGFSDLPDLKKARAQVPQRPGVLRFSFEGLPEDLDGFLNPPLSPQSHSQGDHRSDFTRSHPQRMAKMDLGRIQCPHVTESHTEIVEDIEVVRLMLAEHLQEPDGVRVFASLEFLENHLHRTWALRVVPPPDLDGLVADHDLDPSG